jgi:hypothetical protein
MRSVSFEDPVYLLALQELNLQYPADCKNHILRRAASSGGLSMHPGGEHQKVTKNGNHVTVIPNSVKPNPTCRDIINKLNKHHEGGDEEETPTSSHEGPKKAAIPEPVQKHMDRAMQASHAAKTRNTPEAHDAASKMHKEVADKLGLFHGNAASHHVRMAQHHDEMSKKLRQPCPEGMRKNPQGICQRMVGGHLMPK